MRAQRCYTLTAACPDRVGIVAEVAGFIARHGGWILETSHHADAESKRYFMRVEIRANSLSIDLPQFRLLFTPIAQRFTMDWRITDSDVKKRVAILVSQQGHCLYDLLARWQSRELPIDIACVIANHEDFAQLVQWHGIAFHHVPVPAHDKPGAFGRVARILDDARADSIVLARYMQVLPPALCARYAGQIINIHHSFLPSFVGAKPYHQAYERGVKLIGATCHYVTPELDDGPIIDQDVIRIDHSDSVADLVRYGRDIEKAVLARGLRYHVEDRVLVNGRRTVVFR